MPSFSMTAVGCCYSCCCWIQFSDWMSTKNSFSAKQLVSVCDSFIFFATLTFLLYRSTLSILLCPVTILMSWGDIPALESEVTTDDRIQWFVYVIDKDASFEMIFIESCKVFFPRTSFFEYQSASEKFFRGLGNKQRIPSGSFCK